MDTPQTRATLFQDDLLRPYRCDVQAVMGRSLIYHMYILALLVIVADGKLVQNVCIKTVSV